ncbi:MAG: hypothetical protein E6K56_08690 [Ignavibacteria bacterium]|nr:MAG: hypothetical protein E6K56_08690 [Ignavibacteria bacterium]
MVVSVTTFSMSPEKLFELKLMKRIPDERVGPGVVQCQIPVDRRAGVHFPEIKFGPAGELQPWLADEDGIEKQQKKRDACDRSARHHPGV